MSIDSSTFEVFRKVVESRRSARAFLSETIPDDVLDACSDAAIRAPSSHNLEISRFIDVRNPEIGEKVNHLCLDQPPAVQAPRLIVAIARPDAWKLGCEKLLRRLEQDSQAAEMDDYYRSMYPKLLAKYRIIVPLIFRDGPFGAIAPLKWLCLWVAGLFRPMYMPPFGRSAKREWAVKTTALACENLLLALTAAGYDSCPLEGFDEPRLKRLFSLPRGDRVVMVIAAGKKGPNAIIPQFRFDRSDYVSKI